MNFTDISKVEGMQFDDPYYYLTIAPTTALFRQTDRLQKLLSIKE